MADLTPIPMGIPWVPRESHWTHGIPVFPIPMHTSSLDVSDSMEAHDSSRYCASPRDPVTYTQQTTSPRPFHAEETPCPLVISLCLRRRRIMSPICPSICVCVSGGVIPPTPRAIHIMLVRLADTYRYSFM